MECHVYIVSLAIFLLHLFFVWLSDDDDVPYDKVHLEAQITAGKGTILDKFDMQSVSCLYITGI